MTCISHHWSNESLYSNRVDIRVQRHLNGVSCALPLWIGIHFAKSISICSLLPVVRLSKPWCVQNTAMHVISAGQLKCWFPWWTYNFIKINWYAEITSFSTHSGLMCYRDEWFLLFHRYQSSEDLSLCQAMACRWLGTRHFINQAA